MSDIPLRTLRKSRNSRSGYAPLNAGQDEYDANGSNHQAMPLQTTVTKVAVSVGRQNHQRWKGKKKQGYQDDPEEQEGLLGDDEGHYSEDEVGRAGPARIPTQEVRLASSATLSHLTSNSDPLRGRVPIGNMRVVQKTSQELYRSGHRVCFYDDTVRPTPPELSCFPSQKNCNHGSLLIPSKIRNTTHSLSCQSYSMSSSSFSSTCISCW